MRTQIKIKLHPIIYLLPKKRIDLKYFKEIKEIKFQWLFFTVEMDLVKRNRKEWREYKPKN
jgi:hypothetical protein